MRETIRIMMVEDHAGYRQALERSLRRRENMTLQSQYGTAEFALRDIQYAAAKDVPEILLLDLNLPGMTGLESIPWFKEYAPELKIIVLSQSNAEEDILKAINLGASGYLLKSARFRDIVDGIQTVIDGGASLDPQIANFILSKVKMLQPNSEPTSKTLSAREVETLSLLGEGFSKKEIAEKLEISTTTVAYHVRNIYDKLDALNAPAAVAKGFMTGILPITKPSSE
ncbi:response regulator [Pelagicoccus mobilis]|uniref:Response regulator transcription factor n=1 Tax=Pelagicoccus mobilis TaxID=415221 RepID=A0A934S5R7_9BACT|nr:response regulator transcription factor [Pelagicoccus mobilis]MBK1879894.1 response regulator transcription factor [Pelagicoccus mobilis]